MKQIILMLALLAGIAQETLTAAERRYANIYTDVVSDTLPKWIKEAQISYPTLEQAMPYGWRIAVEPPAPAPGYERLTPIDWVQDPAEPTQAVAQYTDTLIADRLAAEYAATIPRRVLQNQYMLLCRDVSATNTPVRLGMDALQQKLLTIAITNFPREVMLSQYLLALQIGLQREAGVLWWDVCEWTEEAVVKNTAEARHAATMGAMP